MAVVDWNAIEEPDALGPGLYRMRVLGWRMQTSPLAYYLDMGAADHVTHTETLGIGTPSDPGARLQGTWNASPAAKALKRLCILLHVPLTEPEAMCQALQDGGRWFALERIQGPDRIESRFHPDARLQVPPPIPAWPEDVPTPNPPARPVVPRQLAPVDPPTPSVPVALPPNPPSMVPAMPEAPPAAPVSVSRETTPLPVGGLGITARTIEPPPRICPRCHATVPLAGWGAHQDVHEAEDEALEAE